jgi:replicative DNA helicase
MNLEQASVELEGIVLGWLLQSPSYLDTWQLTADDFSEPLHADMFEAIRQAYAGGTPHTVLTLAAQLEASDPITKDCTVPEYVRRIYSGAITNGTQAEHIALKEIANRRRLSTVGESMIWAAKQHDITIEAVAGDAITQLDQVLTIARGKRSRRTIGEAMEAAIETLSGDASDRRIPTGLATLDRMLGGWHRGQFVILAGRPGMGKSMISASTALRTSSKGAGVMMFSLEMSSEEIAMRSLSDLTYTRDTPIPYQRGMSADLTENEVRRWMKAKADYQALPFVIDDKRGLSIAEIASRAREQAALFERSGQRLDLLVVDHLGLVRPSNRYSGNKVAEIGEISDGMATLAKDLDCAVMALSQLNRQVEQRENKRPTLGDLRNSGDLEQDANVVAFAYRPAYYLERMRCDAGTQEEIERQTNLEACRNSVELMIAKNRNGPTDVITLFCDPSCNAVRDLR